MSKLSDFHPSQGNQTEGILSGLRVLDCATYIAGPAAATVMADYGADVIKVERPPYGDPHRYLSFVPGMPVSDIPYCWLLAGRNKRSIALNLAEPPGLQILRKLAASADVFITNFQPQLLERFQLTYENLRALNDGLVYAYVNGYGEEGAESEKPGYDATAYWARSGLMDTLRNDSADPTVCPAGFGDHPTSMALLSAIMMGLYRRKATGKGIKVSTSLIANGAWSNACQIQAALVGAEFPSRRSRTSAMNPLVNHYVSRDGKRFYLCCLNGDHDWRNLCIAADLLELLEDPRFRTVEARRANSSDLIAALDRVFSERDLAEWGRNFDLQNIVWAAVPTVCEVLADPQLQANHVFSDLHNSAHGRPKTVNNPLRFSGTEVRPYQEAPEVGEHTTAILAEIGYSNDAIQDLLKRGIVAAPIDVRTVCNP